MFNFRRFILLFFLLVTCPANSYKMIVLTGGPCAGKTTSLKIIQSELEKIKGSNGNPKFKVFILNEVATSLFTQGKSPETEGTKKRFQELIFYNQMQNERIAKWQANIYERWNPDTECIIICDRGLLDGAAYMEEQEYNKMLSNNNITKQKIFERYYAVFYLRSFSTLNNNLYDKLKGHREEKEEARELDKKVYELWKDHEKFIEIPFETKENIAKNTLKEILKQILLVAHH